MRVTYFLSFIFFIDTTNLMTTLTVFSAATLCVCVLPVLIHIVLALLMPAAAFGCRFAAARALGSRK
jgi:hypothetical protein